MSKFKGIGASLVLGVVLLAVVGCGSQEAPSAPAASAPAAPEHPKQVVVNIEPKNDSGISGTATFTEQDGVVTLVIEISGATPGEHAFHLHEIGDCSAPDGSSAGGHWNPENVEHGKWGTEPFHMGDVGNIVVGADGHGSYTMQTSVWSIGTGDSSDIIGHSVIVHAGVDDFKTQPTGAAGGRIGCGVIR